MPGIDWIPGVSQVKSLVQAATGDTEGAKQTLENFCRECVGVSQVTSVIQIAMGDAEGAWETQKICLGTVNNVANGIPAVGHVKGIVHHAVGDHEGGNQAFNAATRSTVVVASGAAAGIATGGIGAIPAGIAAGVGYDVTASAVSGEDQGYMAAFKNAAKNPTAGSIIDALALPVGDGLAGYSGGQMANKMQLNSLKALREAKLKQSDMAPTDGLKMKYSREVNAYTAKINTIEHGTPYFWDDPKTGTTASEASSSTTAVPVPGYVDKNNQEQEQQRLGALSIVGAFAHIDAQRDDALYCDSYVETIVITDNNRKEAQKKLHKRDEQEPTENLHTYKDVKFTTPEALSDLLNSAGEDPNRDPNRKPNDKLKDCVSQLVKWFWLLLIMPEEFPYTVTTRVNSHCNGLYHSFIRHINEWAEVIPIDFSRVIERLSPLRAEILRLASANDRFDAVEARNQFIAARQQLNRETYNDLQAAFVDIQLSMHRFIQQNLTFENYQGRSLNMDGNERLYFRVETKSGTKAMVICLSENLFEPTTEDERPMRILMTVFFESWAQFNSHGLLERKNEMKKKPKKK